MKSSLKEMVILPSFEKISSYWKEEILTSIYRVWKKEPRALCGVLLDPKDFLSTYLFRMLMRLQLERNLPSPGNYKVTIKVCVDIPFLETF